MSSASQEFSPSVRINENGGDHICRHCERTFRSNRGLNQHLRSCKQNTVGENESEKETQENTESSRNTSDSTITSSAAQKFYKWGNYPSHVFETNVSAVYEQIVHWKKNLFLLPSGKAGKQYIDETTRLMNEWLQESPMKDIAFKAIMIMPNLLLQKPSKNSKAKDHLKALERRLQSWTSGDLLELLKEAETIQKSLTSKKSATSIADISKRFSQEMKKGNVNSAMKILTDNMKHGILPLTKQTLNQLQLKHPEGKEASQEILLTDVPETIHPIKFENIDVEKIQKAAVKTQGGSGPSGMDADGWKRILTSKQFGKSSIDLCRTFAEVIKKICRVENQSTSLEAFLACRLIPLDKNPGLRPIGIGEVLRRIAGKVVVTYLRSEIVTSVGSLQVCAGQEAGCESIIHAMHAIYEDETCEAVLLVDASNAFNSINRNVFLHNITIICPAIAIYVKNCYSIHSRLFVIGGKEIRSCEGTTQGDPVAMAVYAIAIIPMILMIVDITSKIDDSTKTAAYADDVTAAGKVIQLKNWWKTLCMLGPKFGYYPEASKSWLIVKERAKKHAFSVFKDTAIKITNEGQRHLGAVIGSSKYKQEYVQNKIDELINEMKVLSMIAKTEPQAAYSCFITAFKHKPSYIMRTIPDISDHLKQLDEIITYEFIPAITGGIHCSNIERKLLSLPSKLGGLGIPIFAEVSNQEYEYSKMISDDLSARIIRQEVQHSSNTDVQKIKQKIKSQKQQKHLTKLESIRSCLTEEQIRLNNLNQEHGTSSWLTTLPLSEEGYDLTKQLFWDLIRIRYGWTLTRLPAYCECGEKFDLQHALSCKKGGFVSLRHNLVRNITSSLLNEVCKDVRVEPQLQPLTGETFTPTTATGNEVRLDVCARGFWQAGQMAFFDVRVFNPNAKRYAKQELSKTYQTNEKEKKRLYNERIMQVEHGTFTPLVMSATGGMGRESMKFYSRLSELISERRESSYSVVVTWIRRKIVFALMKSIGMCLRGSRSVFNHEKLEQSVKDNELLSELSSKI